MSISETETTLFLRQNATSTLRHRPFCIIAAFLCKRETTFFSSSLIMLNVCSSFCFNLKFSSKFSFLKFERKYFPRFCYSQFRFSQHHDLFPLKSDATVRHEGNIFFQCDRNDIPYCFWYFGSCTTEEVKFRNVILLCLINILSFIIEHVHMFCYKTSIYLESSYFFLHFFLYLHII